MALNRKRVEKPFRKLRKLLKNIPRQPLPEQVHDLRTNTRALEAMAAALSLDSRPRVRKVLKDLARMRKRAGKVRDLDVLTGYAATVHPEGEDNCSVRLLEHLGAERRKKARKLHAVITKYGAGARRELKRSSSMFEKQLCQNNDPACNPGPLVSQATASALRLERELTDPVRLDRRNLHPYRLKVKELRNVLRMAEKANGGQDFIDRLGEVKDSIGEWHDWDELRAIAREVLNHGARCILVRELKRISDQKYDQALQKTETMRRDYLRVSRGKTAHLLKPREPVWEASAALAA